MFSDLKEVIISFCGPSKKEIYQQIPILPTNTRIRIKNVICIKNSAEFVEFATYFENRITELRIDFHNNALNDCIDLLCKFKLLERLKIFGTIEDKHLTKLSTLSQLKLLFSYTIESKTLTDITETLKNFKSLKQFSTEYKGNIYILRKINNTITY